MSQNKSFADSDSVPPLAEILNGLRLPQKQLPSKLFYDATGSQLFEQICALDEYYLTRTETAILRENIHDIAACIGPRALLIEFGSGSSVKTRLLLDAIDDVVGYVPIDISRDALSNAVAELARAYPQLAIVPLHADFTAPFELPDIARTAARRVAFFPGSTVGNFYSHQVVAFLGRVGALVGRGGGLLIGVDLKKDSARLHRAYNDAAGVTAQFNLNLLAHLNRAFGADFPTDQFTHHAFYSPAEGRIEMHLVAQADMRVRLNGSRIPIQKGESILTEVSYKYTVDEFAALAAQTNWRVDMVWTDAQQLFSVQYLTAR
jgi:dimethylhistidine N-methyltransferase